MRLRTRRTQPAVPDKASQSARPPSDGFDIDDDAVWLPGEHALLLRVPLPLRSHRQRLAAVGFAVEDTIAEPLESVHVVLGPELGPGEYLAVVVSRSVMDAWAPRASLRQRLVPDVLALPIPAEGSCAAREIGGRVLVRRADGTGYVASAATFEAFWRADGSPQLVLYGGHLPEGVPRGATGLLPPRADRGLAGFDLLRGPYARATDGRRVALWASVAVAATLAVQGALLAVDTYAIRRIADAREAAVRAEIAARLPELPPTFPLDAALRRVMPDAAAPAGGGFLPLATSVAEALSPVAAQLTLSALAFEAEDATLRISIEAADLATLQRAEAELRAGGLAVAPGAATTRDGRAEVELVIGGTG